MVNNTTINLTNSQFSDPILLSIIVLILVTFIGFYDKRFMFITGIVYLGFSIFILSTIAPIFITIIMICLGLVFMIIGAMEYV